MQLYNIDILFKNGSKLTIKNLLEINLNYDDQRFLTRLNISYHDNSNELLYLDKTEILSIVKYRGRRLWR